MKTITISDEAAQFLATLAKAIETQDNRGTGSPYYISVRGIRELAAPEGHTGVERYFDNTAVCSYTEEELKSHCLENNVDFDVYVDDHCVKYDVQEVEEFENVFFTYDGYKRHMELNGHNYRHFKEVGSYVRYAHRNPEITSLLEAIKEIGGACAKLAEADSAT